MLVSTYGTRKAPAATAATRHGANQPTHQSKSQMQKTQAHRQNISVRQLLSVAPELVPPSKGATTAVLAVQEADTTSASLFRAVVMTTSKDATDRDLPIVELKPFVTAEWQRSKSYPVTTSVINGHFHQTASDEDANKRLKMRRVKSEHQLNIVIVLCINFVACSCVSVRFCSVEC